MHPAHCNHSEHQIGGSPDCPLFLSIADCVNFALSLPIATLITGAEKPEYAREKAALVRAFDKLTADQRMALAKKVADFANAGVVEYYKNKDLRRPA